MKLLLITTIAAVVVVGCGESQQSAPAPEAEPTEPLAEAAKPEHLKAKAPDISIHEAARKGNIEAVKQHMAAGTDVNAKDDLGETSIDWANKYNRVSTVDLLRKHGGRSGSIHGAARDGDIEAINDFLASGTDINAKELRNGWTSLHQAKTKEIAELLIAKGADVNAKSKLGTTPLHYAANREITKLLIAKGSNVNARTSAGQTPLLFAVINGRKETVEILITKGADVNVKTSDGVTPLDMAKKKPEIAELLRKHGGKTRHE